MNLSQVKTYMTGVLKQWFVNKSTLDKFDDSTGILRYNKIPVNNAPVFVSDDAPIGNIIAFMGNAAPQDYLICDGTEYNIADYPYLSQHFIDEFGCANYFGGDGTDTFAVPDLRGEFLRGTGTGTRDTGSGDDVGVHQEPTEIPSIFVYDGTLQYTMPEDAGKSNNFQTNIDKGLNDRKSARYTSTGTINEENYENDLKYTVRPTNTSVLYCIKYKITQNDMFNYSEDERLIGSWINGKNLYEKTIVTTMPQVETTGTFVTEELDVSEWNIDLVTNIYGTVSSTSFCMPINCVINDTPHLTTVTYFNNVLTKRSNHSAWNTYTMYIVIQYTKTTDE